MFLLNILRNLYLRGKFLLTIFRKNLLIFADIFWLNGDDRWILLNLMMFLFRGFLLVSSLFNGEYFDFLS